MRRIAQDTQQTSQYIDYLAEHLLPGPLSYRIPNEEPPPNSMLVLDHYATRAEWVRLEQLCRSEQTSMTVKLLGQFILSCHRFTDMMSSG